MLALSSLSKSRRFVAIMYAGIIFFTAAMYQALRGITGSRAWAVISPGDMLDVIADAVFRIRCDAAAARAGRRYSVIVVLIGASIWSSSAACRARRDRCVTRDRPTEHLSKWYGQVSGLNDVTVSVPPGITGLLGPNGAGKSTFMKLITGQLRPSKGHARARRADLGQPRALSRIGFCPEQDAFYERMTGARVGHRARPLNGFSSKDAADAARRALERVDLLDAAGQKIGAYSKGMRQRVKLAQAIVHEPELLILDEPLSGMDPIMRRRTIRLIKEWARAGKSILVSSHILHEIESMTSNILLINNGRIVAEGNVHQIRDLIDEHPHTVFIRAEDPRALARALLADDGVSACGSRRARWSSRRRGPTRSTRG